MEMANNEELSSSFRDTKNIISQSINATFSGIIGDVNESLGRILSSIVERAKFMEESTLRDLDVILESIIRSLSSKKRKHSERNDNLTKDSYINDFEEHNYRNANPRTPDNTKIRQVKNVKSEFRYDNDNPCYSNQEGKVKNEASNNCDLE